MKKLLFFAVVALFLGLASCSETKKVDEASTFIEQLTTQLEAGDTAALEATMDLAMTKATELAASDPEGAKTIITEIQQFIKDNKEKILATGANEENLTMLVETPADVFLNALTAGQSIIDNTENLTETVDEAVANKANELKEGVENTANEQVETAKQKAAEQVNAAKQEGVNKVNEAKQKANDEVNKAAEKANKDLNDAANKALKSVGL